ncbi:hypothetical protein E5288_WYG016771 [Bos mutus]|uniref:Uncharacterized protein n=1 Tax=Bos mutus TaxID=72004 RepID=A0A6B0R8X6_9CETA|nr:hypothetical protein [Bos mutus]
MSAQSKNGNSSGFEVKMSELTWDSDPGSGRSFLHPSVWNSGSNLENTLLVCSTLTPPGKSGNSNPAMKAASSLA